MARKGNEKINKTKEQIEKEMETLQKVRVYRAFVKDEFYPALQSASNSLDDAKFLLTGLANMVFQEFLTLMKQSKFADLHLEAKLDPKNNHYEDHKKLLSLFKEKNVFESRELIEGMKGEIDAMITNEMKDRKLDSLKTMWFEI